MNDIYFPGPAFCWVYLVFLLSILAVAAYHDLRALVIPKKLSLFALGLGLVVNTFRGAWLGGGGSAVWALDAGGPWIGGLDGLFFALAGFAAGFTVFFAFWLFGICGGGDVKLFAALGAWVGPYLLLLVLMGTLVVVCLLAALRIFWKVLTGRSMQLAPQRLASPLQRNWPAPKARPRHQALGFSLPLALACLLVLPWVFRADLRFVAPPERAGAAADLQPR